MGSFFERNTDPNPIFIVVMDPISERNAGWKYIIESNAVPDPTFESIKV